MDQIARAEKKHTRNHYINQMFDNAQVNERLVVVIRFPGLIYLIRSEWFISLHMAAELDAAATCERVYELRRSTLFTIEWDSQLSFLLCPRPKYDFQ